MESLAEVLDLESVFLFVSAVVGGGGGGGYCGAIDNFTAVLDVDRPLLIRVRAAGSAGTLLRSILALHLDNVLLGVKDSFITGN